MSVQTTPARPATMPIAEVVWRRQARVSGRVRQTRIQPRTGAPTLECTLVDPSGGLTLIFLGRRALPGIDLGRRLVVEGMVGEHHRRLAILNPRYELLP